MVSTPVISVRSKRGHGRNMEDMDVPTQRRREIFVRVRDESSDYLQLSLTEEAIVDVYVIVIVFALWYCWNCIRIFATKRVLRNGGYMIEDVYSVPTQIGYVILNIYLLVLLFWWGPEFLKSRNLCNPWAPFCWAQYLERRKFLREFWRKN